MPVESERAPNLAVKAKSLKSLRPNLSAKPEARKRAWFLLELMLKARGRTL
jgi:hypothetical protein